MITDKVGNKSYLGIEINYDKEARWISDMAS